MSALSSTIRTCGPTGRDDFSMPRRFYRCTLGSSGATHGPWLACGATVVYFSMEKPKPDPRASIGTRLKEFEAEEAERILNACTRCGKCYEVCPMARYSSAPA